MGWVEKRELKLFAVKLGGVMGMDAWMDRFLDRLISELKKIALN